MSWTLTITYKNRFIYTVQGDPHWAADELRDYLVFKLEKEGAGNVVVRDTMIRFEGNPWAFFRWHFFHVISKGKITVDYRSNHLGVVYQISFLTYFMMYVILPTCAWIAFEFLIAHMTVLQALPMLLEIVYMCWLLLFGGTVALNYYRFNQFMKDCLREFFSSASSLGVQG